jgi:dihydrofolate reductase
MGRVVFDTSMSLDGFMTASNQTAEEPLGRGGEEHLHAWAMGSDARGRELLDNAVSGLGAAICGRTTYDDSIPWWGANGPTGAVRRPTFVVTHDPPADSPEGGVYSFVTDGIESALERAQAVAGDKVVSVMGGANLGRQYIAAGLVDEIQIHLVPVLFGGGTRMFGELTDGHIALEPVEVVESAAATHLRYRVVR